MFFCEYCEIFKKTYFEEHLRTAAFATSHYLHWNYSSRNPNFYGIVVKKSFLVVKIRSIHCEIEDRKQFDFLIRSSRSKVFMKFLRQLFSTVKLKSPIKMVLSYYKVSWPNAFDRWSTKYLPSWDGSLYNSTIRHFFIFHDKIRQNQFNFPGNRF